LRRRDFIATFVAGAVWSPKSDAQQPRLAVVGGLWHGIPSSPTSLAGWDAFAQGLREEGYVGGDNIVIHNRLQTEPEGLQRAAAELVALDVEVIVAGGTTAAFAAKRTTATVPIVVAAMADPFADGLVTWVPRTYNC
jgi:ABC-type uncharacterized transport system substrate-binding protein